MAVLNTIEERPVRNVRRSRRRIGGRQPRWWSLPLLAALLALALGALAPAPAAGQQSGRSVTYGRFDVDIALEPSGNFRVTETLVIDFSGGPFVCASCNISLACVVDILYVTVCEGDLDFAFTHDF